MITVTSVRALREVDSDLDSGELFYESQSSGVGTYFRDTLISDMESLILFAGTHPRIFGAYRMLSKRFPYSIYYEIIETEAVIVAVLSQRRNPLWIRKQLRDRV